MSIKKVFAVSMGSYSDYRVLFICGDKITAEDWLDAVKKSENCQYDEPFIEEFRLIPTGKKPYTESIFHRQITLRDDGSTEHDSGTQEDKRLAGMHWYGPPPRRPMVRFVRAPIHRNLGGRLEIRAASADLVNKVFSDRMAAWKAGAWNTREEIDPEREAE